MFSRGLKEPNFDQYSHPDCQWLASSVRHWNGLGCLWPLPCPVSLDFCVGHRKKRAQQTQIPKTIPHVKGLKLFHDFILSTKWHLFAYRIHQNPTFLWFVSFLYPTLWCRTLCPTFLVACFTARMTGSSAYMRRSRMISTSIWSWSRDARQLRNPPLASLKWPWSIESIVKLWHSLRNCKMGWDAGIQRDLHPFWILLVRLLPFSWKNFDPRSEWFSPPAVTSPAATSWRISCGRTVGLYPKLEWLRPFSAPKKMGVSAVPGHLQRGGNALLHRWAGWGVGSWGNDADGWDFADEWQKLKYETWTNRWAMNNFDFKDLIINQSWVYRYTGDVSVCSLVWTSGMNKTKPKPWFGDHEV